MNKILSKLIHCWHCGMVNPDITSVPGGTGGAWDKIDCDNNAKLNNTNKNFILVELIF